jgi:hypothetical protein
VFHLRSPKLYEFFIALWLLNIYGCIVCGVFGKCRASYPAGAEKRNRLVVIDVVSLAEYFLSLLQNWRGASARDFEALCKFDYLAAIAKFTNRPNDNKQSSRRSHRTRATCWRLLARELGLGVKTVFDHNIDVGFG